MTIPKSAVLLLGLGTPVLSVMALSTRGFRVRGSGPRETTTIGAASTIAFPTHSVLQQELAGAGPPELLWQEKP